MKVLDRDVYIKFKLLIILTATTYFFFIKLFQSVVIHLKIPILSNRNIYLPV